MTTRREILLAILAAADGRPYTPVQIQKAAFLVTQNAPHLFRPSPTYHFAPYDYGPFDHNVYSDAETLQAEGLAEITQPSGARWNRYAATDRGIESGQRILANMKNHDRSYVESVSAWVRSLDFGSLVKSIYEAYPDMRANSIFRG